MSGSFPQNIMRMRYIDLFKSPKDIKRRQSIKWMTVQPESPTGNEPYPDRFSIVSSQVCHT